MLDRLADIFYQTTRPRTLTVIWIVGAVWMLVLFGAGAVAAFVLSPPGTFAGLFAPGLGSGTIGVSELPMFAFLGAEALFLLAIFRQNRDYWQKGARIPARSVEEARLYLTLTPDEKIAFQRIIGRNQLLMIPVLVVVMTIAFFGMLMLVPNWAAMLGIGIVVTAPLPVLGHRNVKKFRAFFLSTEFARANGCTKAIFKAPWYRVFRSNSYYREVMPELEKSPFEEET